jgi:hypothetical protein
VQHYTFASPPILGWLGLCHKESLTLILLPYLPVGLSQ